MRIPWGNCVNTSILYTRHCTEPPHNRFVRAFYTMQKLRKSITFIFIKQAISSFFQPKANNFLKHKTRLPLNATSCYNPKPEFIKKNAKPTTRRA